MFLFTFIDQLLNSFLLTVIWNQIFLSNTNNFLTYLFLTINGTTQETIISNQSAPGSNGNEGALYTSQIFRTWASPSDEVYNDTLGASFCADKIPQHVKQSECSKPHWHDSKVNEV